MGEVVGQSVNTSWLLLFLCSLVLPSISVVSPFRPTCSCVVFKCQMEKLQEPSQAVLVHHVYLHQL